LGIFWLSQGYLRIKITKNSNRGLKFFFPGKMSSLVLYESLTSISLPGSPNNASFSQGIWLNCVNFYILATSIANMRVNIVSGVTNWVQGPEGDRNQVFPVDRKFLEYFPDF